MKREIITTADGSTTIHLPDWNESYHSKHGAIQEAYHVFIKNGLDKITRKEIRILEIGFGTGLNAFITLLEGIKQQKQITYYGVEAFPVPVEEIHQLNYLKELGEENLKPLFQKLHDLPWEMEEEVTPAFSLNKIKDDFRNVQFDNKFELIYYDAFGPRVQPELWSQQLFATMYIALKKGGVLTTYCAKGDVRRAMQEVGFTVNRVEGPPGKREMLVALKN
ncbi:hypothetical protein GCM10011414_19830 [Croceivirga lutea]|uniref:tRNA (5-methylaminomethyl-2-thiouridine)(34)-methyltransferase MnmD n=1 Tax=Croceivirga lutea TaxID=1775167 RepID=UPI00163ADD73|nr:tRNA (5-methylaminomethyl-2-thiouridine)(34)-methyltransferase MnmD [Croceivirga lutea]GGG50068.1 hypothetical protein GCM10011414_19830 [Croceivirga lutea]